MTIEKKLSQFGIKFPEESTIVTIANYAPYKICNDQLFISGQLPKDIFTSNANFQNAPVITGILGLNCTLEQGQYAAKMCAIQLLYIAKLALGSLERIQSCIQLNVFVASAQSFTNHHLIANGASDLMCEILGTEIGQHSRVAVGVSSLPLGTCVEVSVVFEVERI